MKLLNLFLQCTIFVSSDTYGGTMNLNIAYIRVSTVEQNEARQVKAMKHYNIDKVYQEKVSAKNIDRPKLQEMLDFAREGDTIYIADFSRLARSTKDLLELVELIESKGVQLFQIKRI